MALVSSFFFFATAIVAYGHGSPLTARFLKLFSVARDPPISQHPHPIQTLVGQSQLARMRRRIRRTPKEVDALRHGPRPIGGEGDGAEVQPFRQGRRGHHRGGEKTGHRHPRAEAVQRHVDRVLPREANSDERLHVVDVGEEPQRLLDFDHDHGDYEPRQGHIKRVECISLLRGSRWEGGPHELKGPLRDHEFDLAGRGIVQNGQHEIAPIDERRLGRIRGLERSFGNELDPPVN